MCSTTPRNRFLLIRLSGIPLFAASLSASAAGQCYYTYEFIVSPPGGWADPYAINNLGHVAGTVEVNGTDRAFVWTPKTGMQYLPWPPGAIRMNGTGINDLGHICGWLDWASNEVSAFLWNGTDYYYIRNPYQNRRIEALDVNNHDQVVGMLTDVDGRGGFLWEDGVLTELDPIIGAPEPRVVAINDYSVIAGHAGLANDKHAWLLFYDGVRWLPESDLTNSAVIGLSNSTNVVGYGSVIPGEGARGCYWDDPALHLLVPPPQFLHAFCRSVNNAGRVVGSYYRQTYGLTDGYAWQSGGVYPLRQYVSGISVPIPIDINEFGQIVAYAGVGPVVLTPSWKPGDISGDCVVGIDDLMEVLGNFGAAASLPPRGDVDFNGVVDVTDLAIMLSNWGL